MTTLFSNNLHYIYYAITKEDKPKVGATKNLKRRALVEKYKLIKPIEAYTCDKKAGDREIELQLKYFGKRDSKLHYSHMIKAAEKTPKGEKVKTSKITKEQAEFIKKNYFKIINQHTEIPKGKYSCKQLKEMFNISKKQIQNIVNGHFWK